MRAVRAHNESAVNSGFAVVRPPNHRGIQRVFHSSTGDRTTAMKKKGGAKKSAKKKRGAKKKAAKKK
jgi:hypothetical protein